MSIIGHSIQNAVANVHIALKSQLAAQAALSDEDAQRKLRVQREEQLARDTVTETAEARQSRVNAGERRRDDDSDRDSRRDEPPEEYHLDLLA